MYITTFQTGNTNLSDRQVLISKVSFSINATSFAILCFSAETGPEFNNRAL